MAAVKRRPKQAKLQQRRSGWRWWQGMAFGLLLSISPGGLLLVLVLGAPVLLTVVAEESASTPLVRTIVLFTVAGSIDTTRSFLLGSHDLAGAIALLADMRSLPIAWTAAAAGWLLNEACCLVARWTTDLRSAQRARSLEAELAALRLEWSLPDP